MHNINGAAVYAWSEQPEDRPMPRIDRKRIIGSQMMISQVRLHKGFAVATHSHANEQFALVLSGRIRFGIGADGSKERREVELTGGQVLHLPSNVPHSAEALEETLILDLFSPPSATTGVDVPHAKPNG